MIYPLLCGFFFLLLLFLSVRLYQRSKAVAENHIRNAVLAVVSIAANDFAKESGALESMRTRADMTRKDFSAVVQRLKDIRTSIPGIRFAYIMRRTEDPMTLEFIADADSLATDGELDVNGNGTVDDDEKGSYPGDSYDISETPAMRESAFEGPTTDADFSHDSWGTWISAYAPIRSTDGKVVGILGIDMGSSEYDRFVNEIFPQIFALLGSGLLFCLGVTFTGFLLHFSRVSAEQKAESTAEELRSAEDVLHTILENLPVALFCKDVKNGYRFNMWNKESEKMFGLQSNAVIGKSDYDLFTKTEADFFRQTDEKVMSQGKIVDIPVETIVSKSLGKIFLHTRKVPIVDQDGNPQYLLGISENITDRKIHDDEMKKRAIELQQMNDLMVGRELRMQELKKEIEKLKEKKDSTS